jgi:hypothetical protein
MVLLGLSGAIGHGKSALAAALSAHEPRTLHLETSGIIIEVADALHAALTTVPDELNADSINPWLETLPGIIKRLLGRDVPFKSLALKDRTIADHPENYQKLFVHIENLRHGRVNPSEPIRPATKELNRPLLQWLGGYLVQRVDQGVWWDEIIRRSVSAQEDGIKLVVAGAVRYPADADIVRRAGGYVVSVFRPGMPEHDLGDPTESQRRQIIADATVFNDGGLHLLDPLAAAIYEDALSGDLKKTYSAADFA